MVSYDYQCESSAQRPPPKLGQFWEILRNFDTTRLKLLFSVYIWYHNHANVFRQQLYLVGFWYHDHGECISSLFIIVYDLWYSSMGTYGP